VSNSTYALGPFRLVARNDLLFRGTEPVTLGRRAVALLRALVERAGAVVSKDTLIEAAWPGQVVEEANLTVQIAALRRVLSTEPGGERWIQTMPRRGYRFVGPVAVEEEIGGTAPLPRVDPAPDAAPTRQVKPSVGNSRPCHANWSARRQYPEAWVSKISARR
jgi:DNA-binding winged helix-turn-helix (wHTH) protein